MLKLRKNKRNNLYICFARRDVRKLTYLTAKFQKDPIEPLLEIPGKVMVNDEHSSFGAVKKCWQKLPMLCRLPFSKSFQSDNHVYYDLNNSILEFFI